MPEREGGNTEQESGARSLTLRTESDWQKELKCGNCDTISSIRGLRKEHMQGYRGDSVAAPVYELLCNGCGNSIAQLDESDQKYSDKETPYINLAAGTEIL